MIIQSFLAKTSVMILISVILLLVFMAYFAPDMMVALTNQVWAMCGW